MLFTVQYSKLDQKLFAVFTVQCLKKINSEVDFKLEMACSIHGVVRPLKFRP